MVVIYFYRILHINTINGFRILLQIFTDETKIEILCKRVALASSAGNSIGAFRVQNKRAYMLSDGKWVVNGVCMTCPGNAPIELPAEEARVALKAAKCLVKHLFEQEVLA